MERRIGEVFEFEGKQYEVCKTHVNSIAKCDTCDLADLCFDGYDSYKISGDCRHNKRKDGRSVIFKELVPNIKTFNK